MSKVYHALLWVFFWHRHLVDENWPKRSGFATKGLLRARWELCSCGCERKLSAVMAALCHTQKCAKTNHVTKYKHILTLCDTHTTSTCWRIWTIYEHRPFLRALTLLHVSLFPDSCQAMEMITPPQRNVSNVRLSDSTTDNYPQDCPP